MNRKIFDIGSSNTFNNKWMEWFGREEKEISFPPWLKLPSHYTVDLWKIVTKIWDGHTSISDKILELECGHSHFAPSIGMKMHAKSFRKIYVNCTRCGGTGEIRII